MSNLSFVLVLVQPALLVAGYYLVPVIGTVGYFTGPLFLFGLVLLIERFIGKAPTKPMAKPMSQNALVEAPWLVLCIIAALQLFLIAWGAIQAAHTSNISVAAFIGLTLSIGLTAWSMGIMAAHMLLFDQNKFQRNFGLAMMRREFL